LTLDRDRDREREREREECSLYALSPFSCHYMLDESERERHKEKEKKNAISPVEQKQEERGT